MSSDINRYDAFVYVIVFIAIDVVLIRVTYLFVAFTRDTGTDKIAFFHMRCRGHGGRGEPRATKFRIRPLRTCTCRLTVT